MNKDILKDDCQEFINSNLDNDITMVILKGSPFASVSIQELANQILAKKKCKFKLPSWYQKQGIYYPAKISIEQTSSEITAEYKSSLLKGNTIIDVTGGFGVDCHYFAKKIDNVTHCEINKDLSEIVSHNNELLDNKNIKVVSFDGIQYLKGSKDDVFDCVYIDPSRRKDKNTKVFLLEDCLPNVLEHLDVLFDKSKQILIKYSPMLDITYGLKVLKFVKEVHVVSVANEVKELLFLLEKDYCKEPIYKAINIKSNETQIFKLSKHNFEIGSYSQVLQFLYEPNAAILKLGAFEDVASQCNVKKLHRHSHLYTSSNDLIFPGRKFKVIEVLNYNKKKLKQFAKANIVTRNFPMTVNQIRKETKIKDGGDVFLFFTKIIGDKNIVIVCSKI